VRQKADCGTGNSGVKNWEIDNRFQRASVLISVRKKPAVVEVKGLTIMSAPLIEELLKVIGNGARVEGAGEWRGPGRRGRAII
jgi:hypothetical protein